MKISIIENYLSYRVGEKLILTARLYILKVLKVIPLLATIGNTQPSKFTYPIYLLKDFDHNTKCDDTKYGGLIMSNIILHALSVVSVSILPLSHTPMHRAISYRAVQLHIRYAK